MLCIIVVECGESSVAVQHCLGVITLKYVKLIFLMPSTSWTFRLLFELAFLTSAVQSPIDELHYSYVVSFGETLACVSNPSPVDGVA